MPPHPTTALAALVLACAALAACGDDGEAVAARGDAAEQPAEGTSTTTEAAPTATTEPAPSTTAPANPEATTTTAPPPEQPDDGPRPLPGHDVEDFPAGPGGPSPYRLVVDGDCLRVAAPDRSFTGLWPRGWTATFADPVTVRDDTGTVVWTDGDPVEVISFSSDDDRFVALAPPECGQGTVLVVGGVVPAG